MSSRGTSEAECSFFLARKKRPCRMRTSEGMRFCPHHSHLATQQDPKKGPRIPCPFDPSHFCYEAKLQQHLKKCNAREKEKPEYYVANINTEDNTVQQDKLGLGDISDEELLQFIHRVKSLYEAHHEEVEVFEGAHPLVESAKGKHGLQQSSLLALAEGAGLLEKGRAFVEFGAGRGHLMSWLIKCSEPWEGRTYILVDRSTHRHKADNKFKDSDLQIERIRIDIQHLFLGNVGSLQGKLEAVVGVSKHLCGAATDLAIRCATETLISKEEKVKHNFVFSALGLVMSLCCHHRCEWGSWVGRGRLSGLSQRDFQLLCRAAGWATCGTATETVNQEQNKSEALLNRYGRLGLGLGERAEVGRQCKRLLDVGRLLQLRASGYAARLVQYVGTDVSPENVALVATRS